MSFSHLNQIHSVRQSLFRYFLSFLHRFFGFADILITYVLPPFLADFNCLQILRLCRLFRRSSAMSFFSSAVFLGESSSSSESESLPAGEFFKARYSAIWLLRKSLRRLKTFILSFLASYWFLCIYMWMFWASMIYSAFFLFSFLSEASSSLHWASSSAQLPPTLPQLGQVFGFGSCFSAGISSSGITTASPKVEIDWALSTFGASSFALTTRSLDSVYGVSASDGWTSAVVVTSGADASAGAGSYSSTAGAVGSSFEFSVPSDGWTSAVLVASGADAPAGAGSYSLPVGTIGSSFGFSSPQQSSVGAEASGADVSVFF